MTIAVLLRHLRDLFATVDEIAALTKIFDTEPGAVGKLAAATALVVQLKSQAAILDESRTTRWITGLPPGDTIRATAQTWQETADTLWRRIEACRRVYGQDHAPA